MPALCIAYETEHVCWCKQRTLGRNKTRNHGESSSENALQHSEKFRSFHNGLSLESNLPTLHQSSSPTLQIRDIFVILPLLSCFCRRKRGHQEFLSWTNRWGQRGCRHRDQPNDLPVPAQWTCGLLQREIKRDHYFTCSATTVLQAPHLGIRPRLCRAGSFHTYSQPASRACRLPPTRHTCYTLLVPICKYINNQLRGVGGKLEYPEPPNSPRPAH